MNTKSETVTPAKTTTGEHACRKELRMMSAIARASILAYQRLVTASVDAALVQLDAVDEYTHTGEAPAAWAAHWERDDAGSAPLQPTAIGFVSELLDPVTHQAVALAFGGLGSTEPLVTWAAAVDRAVTAAKKAAPAGNLNELTGVVIDSVVKLNYATVRPVVVFADAENV